MQRAQVQDASRRHLSPCDADKALRMVAQGRATLVREHPLTVRLGYTVPLPKDANQADEQATEPDYRGQRLLLHICCAPCATYSVRRLREIGWSVEGLWFNPNIHPFGEHERRREALATYAPSIDLPMHWEPGYEMPTFMRAVVGHERFGERCSICYRMRLERTARVARRLGYDAISTTLLISPYQDQATIRRAGEKAAASHGVTFYFENLRRGFAEHYRLAKEADLYMQRYCGCVYSEWESRDRQAWTHPRSATGRLSKKG